MSEHMYTEQTRYLWSAPGAMREMTQQLCQKLPYSDQPIVLVCIGTDRSTGDSLGPLTGSLVKERRLSHLHVYGTLEQPVHAKNLVETLELIENLHENPFVIAVDACLGRCQNVGTVVVGEGPLLPGSALGRDLPPVGDLHMTGIVNVSGFMELTVLQSTRLHTVMNLAKLLASTLKYVDWKLQQRKQAMESVNSNILAFKKVEVNADSV